MQRTAPYTCVELWNDLEHDFQNFMQENKVVASTEQDEAAFQHAKETMQEVYETGKRAQATSFFFHPYEKARLGLRLKNIFPEKFGPEKSAKLEGEKSLAFIAQVILPFEDNTQKVEHEWWLVMLCGLVGMDIKAEMEVAGKVANNYREQIAEYEARKCML